MADKSLPTDEFSKRLRELQDNPGAQHASSTVNRQDFYGNAESWILDVFRVDGREEGFLQRINADGGTRLLLPPEVMTAVFGARERAIAKGRRIAARAGLATKRLRGIDPAAGLRKARARKAAKKR